MGKYIVPLCPKPVPRIKWDMEVIQNAQVTPKQQPCPTNSENVYDTCITATGKVVPAADKGKTEYNCIS